MLSLSRSPCLIDGNFEPRHVDLRPFILHGQETRMVPRRNSAVWALRRGSLVVNSSQGGGGKDIWVLGGLIRMLSRSAQGFVLDEQIPGAGRVRLPFVEATDGSPGRPPHIGKSTQAGNRIYNGLNRQPPLGKPGDDEQ